MTNLSHIPKGTHASLSMEQQGAQRFRLSGCGFHLQPNPHQQRRRLWNEKKRPGGMGNVGPRSLQSKKCSEFSRGAIPAPAGLGRR